MTARIKKAVETDAAGILAIENICFSFPHTREQLLREISSGNSIVLTAYEEDQVCGFVTAQCVMDEGYIGDVAVAERSRRRGIGDALLKELRREAERRQLSFVTLEVRESNAPAIALYEKNGYKKISVMKDYYTQPKENAVIMTLLLQ